MNHIPKNNQHVFYTYMGDAKEAEVVGVSTHASAQTPVVELRSVHPKKEGDQWRAHINPAYLFTSKEEAIAENRYIRTAGTLEHLIACRSEDAKLNGAPPAWIAQVRNTVVSEYRRFKAEQAGRAVQRLVPGITTEEANRRFARGMQILNALRDAHSHVACEEFSRVLLEETQQGLESEGNAEAVSNVTQVRI